MLRIVLLLLRCQQAKCKYKQMRGSRSRHYWNSGGSEGRVFSNAASFSCVKLNNCANTTKMKKLREILLIEDDEATNFLNQRLLRSLDICEQVTVKLNGELGYNYLLETWQNDKSRPELIILDHHMPVMDGLELMERLGRKGLLDQVTVVFLLLAVDSSKAEIQLFQKAGVQEFTDKPLCKETVMEAYAKYWAGDTVDELRQREAGLNGTGIK